MTLRVSPCIHLFLLPLRSEFPWLIEGAAKHLEIPYAHDAEWSMERAKIQALFTLAMPSLDNYAEGS